MANKRKTRTLAGCLAMLTAFSSTLFAAELADRVLINGYIETMNPSQPKAEAVAMKDGRIVYVGNSDAAQLFAGEGTDVINLEGKYVTPGFLETHNHLVAESWLTSGVDLSGAKTPDDIGRILKDYADKNPDEKVIVGNGWTYAAMDNARPTTADLDKWGIDRPVVAVGNFCHDAVFNSIGLQKAKIDLNAVTDLQPGIIYWDRDDNGQATGLGVEGQWAKGYIDMGAWDSEKIIPVDSEYRQGYMATQGVTTAMTPGLITPPAIVSSELTLAEFRLAAKILKERVDSGKAKLRMGIQPLFKLPDADPQTYVDTVAEVKKEIDSDMLWGAGIKLHTDVAWPDRLTSLDIPYKTPNPDGSPNYGAFGISPDRLWEVVMRANANGFGVVAHSDGVRMNRALIDIYIEARKRYPDSRNRLDHITFMAPEDRDRVVAHNIPVNATTGFANEVDAGPGGETLFDEIDKEYVLETYGSYTELAQRYDNVSISGDSPGFPLEKAYPVYSMQAAMTRRAPDRDSKPFPPNRPNMTYDQVLAAHTTIPAWQLHKEDDLGSIEVGKFADMAIFENNLRKVAKKDPMMLIKKGKVVGTLLGGEFTHRDGM